MVKRRDERSSDGTDVEEKEANFFAAELLMPASFIEKDIAAGRGTSLSNEAVIESLADQYKVSTQALIIRLAYLGHIEL
jgi:Zn-dependent peptidase ImmA (M78 family)